MIHFHKIAEVLTSAAMTVGTFTLTVANPSLPTSTLPFFTSIEYAAAICGAGVAEFARLFPQPGEKSNPSIGTLWVRASKGAFFWILCSVFALFMGKSFALLPVLDPIGAIFIAGVTARGIVSVLISPNTTRDLIQSILERLKK